MTNGSLPAKRRPGRPSLLTPDRKAKILSAVRCGCTYKTACMAAGIGERTFQTWKVKGEDPSAPLEYRQFLRELTQAVEEGQAARVALIQQAAREDWRAAAWLLERMDPERWSLRYRIEHTVGKPMTVSDYFRQLEGAVEGEEVKEARTW